jgi:predicted ATPase/class 3 adenylate cyclase
MTAQPATSFPFGDLPEGTVTFLFSDIESSTQMLYRLGNQFTMTLAEHHKILRQVIALSGGHVVRTEGDSFFVAFPRVTSAVTAAVKAQRTLAQHTWPEGAAIRVRMGLHTGEPEVALDDYVGIAVHRAARIASVGHGGQVLLSETATALACDELPEGVSLLDLGYHLLKDLRRPERICQLCIEGLPAAFPPLKTLGARPHGLPLQLTSFIGREQEMDEIKNLIPSTHLLTLTGIGGTGKTRLALQVAADLIDDFPAGIWVVELAPLQDPALVPQAVALVLGLPEQPGCSLSDLLVDHLREKHLMLMLDNCEHVVEACAWLVERLLLSAPDLKILATSRVPLNLAGETTYPVLPLSLPDPHQTASPPTLTQYESVRLFIDRAVSIQPSFCLTHSNAPAVAQICQHLDGIPLAIELAACRLRLLSPEQIASRLGDRFSLLTGGSRTALPRQQTLQATMDWSYDLLTEAERKLFNRLAVFVGGFSLEAIESVCADESNCGAHEVDLSPSQVLDLLAALVAHSLVIVEERKVEARYNLLETVRQYAFDKLQASSKLCTLQDRHLVYFLGIAQQGGPHSWVGRPDWINHFETEIENFRAAFEYALTTNPESAILLLGSLDMFLTLTSRVREGHGWAMRTFLLTEDWPPGKMRAMALILAGDYTAVLGEYQQGEALLQAGLEMAREVDDKNEMRHALYCLTAMNCWRSDWAQMHHYAEQHMVISREMDEKDGICRALWQLGESAWRSGDTETGRKLHEQCLEMARQEEFPLVLVCSLDSLAELAWLSGDKARAKACYTESAQIKRQMGWRAGLAWTLNALGQLLLQEGDYLAPNTLAEECLTIYRELKSLRGLVYCLAAFASTAGITGKDKRAACLFGAVEAATETLDLKMGDMGRMTYDPIIAAVRERLGEASFDAAWAEGREMTLEQAIAYAHT